MSFHYDDEQKKVVDSDFGVEIFSRGRSEVGMRPFVFFDPRTTVRTFRGAGLFPFEAKYIEHVEGGSEEGAKVVVKLDGYQIDRQALRHTFATYTGGDEGKFELVCELISAGLREWLTSRGSEADAKVLIV